VELPCIPNGGGFSLDEINSVKSATSSRTLILCKGYGGMFGQAQLAIPAITSALIKYNSVSVFFYSVTSDIEHLIILLQNKFGKRVHYSTVSSPLSREKLLNLFCEARVYIGCSKSDAISTSFLEALVCGAYPIQTNTSCANEWISKGIAATLVGLSEAELTETLDKVLDDNNLVDFAQIRNVEIARKFLTDEHIKKIAKKFYSLK
jgi:glycosyltransferase involved in cell wall biosynthesis